MRIVEEHHLRAAAGEHVALEVKRQHQKPVDLAGQDHAAPLREIADAHGHGRKSGVGIDHADDAARQIRTVEIENADRQPRRQSGTEDGGEEGHLGKRHDRRQAEQERAPPQPADFSPEHQPEARPDIDCGPSYQRPRLPHATTALMPRTQAIDRLQRQGANLEGTQIEFAGGARRPPRRVLPLHVDHGDLDRNNLRLQRRYDHVELVADLQAAEQILAQVEREPEFVHVDHREQRRARR